MATLTQLSTSNLALKGAGDDYNFINRFFKTKAEADAALADGSWVPVAERFNACLTGDQGLLVYNESTSSLDLADAATRSYIDSQIAALTGDAPGVLDTLGEISDALNDNPNFFSDAEAARQANTNLINAETARATAAEGDLQDYVDQQIATDMWLFADQSAFPSATDNHGRVVHSHADGAMFYAHGGMWHKIENEAEAEAARAAIQSDVDQNEADADAADAALSARLDTLEADPTTAAAVAAVQADVDQNEADADAADAALGVRIDAVETEIDTARTNIYTALGQTEGATAMGTFTGSTLGDGQTIKQLLQTLETATETEISDRQAAIADILDGATFTGDIVLGTLARLKESGNELKIQNDTQSSSIVLGPKISLQPATGSRIELFETVRMPDGTDLTVTGAELNFVDGVTSNIQTQLDAIQADVDQNESDVDAAAAALSGRLDVLEADPTTETALATERARIDAILASADADKDSFAEIVTLINSVDAENDNAFAGYVTSNDAALATERGRIDAVETEIDTARTNIYTALGQAEGATAMGTFTGSTLGDGQTVKQLLQSLETATEGETTARTAIAEFVSNLTRIKNDLRGTYINVGNNIELRPAPGGRVEITGDLYLDNNTAIDGNGTILTSFANINAYDGRLNTLEADPTTATAVAAVQADVDQNESDADAAIALKLDASAVSAFGLTLVDDADAAAARTTLGVDAAGTDNSTDVTIAAGRDYVTITDQELTLGAVDLAADVTGVMPVANGGTGASDIPGVKSALDIDHIHTTLGVAASSDDLGTFDGSTIADNQTVKEALQALETAQEATQADVDQNESDADTAIANILNGTSIPGPYNNDSEAATGGVAVGAIYKNSNGTIHWRVS